MIVPEHIAERKQSIEQRLKHMPDDANEPMFSARNIHSELAGRTHAINYGGIGLIHQLGHETA